MSSCALCGREVTGGRQTCGSCAAACFTCGHDHRYRQPCPRCPPSTRCGAGRGVEDATPETLAASVDRLVAQLDRIHAE